MTKTNKYVRQATQEDVSTIVDLVIEGLEEIKLDYDKDLVTGRVSSSIKTAPTFLYIEKEKAVGVAGYTLCNESYSQNQILTGYIFYIQSNYRNDQSVSALINATKEHSINEGIDLRVEFAVVGDFDRRKKLMEKFGFEVTDIVGTLRT